MPRCWRCAARMYGMPELGAKADAVARSVGASRMTALLRGNAKRRRTERSRSRRRTETAVLCVLLHTATRQTHPAEGARCATISAQRSRPEASEIHFAKRLHRKLLRLECSPQGLSRNSGRERAISGMEALTDIWENDTPTRAVQGFASMSRSCFTATCWGSATSTRSTGA